MELVNKSSRGSESINILEKIFVIMSGLGIALPLAHYLFNHPPMSEMSALIFGFHAGLFCLLLMYGVVSELARPSPQPRKRGYRI